MTSRSKRKGDKAERDLANWLTDNGYPDAHRYRAGWSDDIGDIGGVPGLVIEVKDAKDKRWNPWLDQLDGEKIAAQCADGVLVVKLAGQTDPGEWLAIRRVRDEFNEGTT